MRFLLILAPLSGFAVTGSFGWFLGSDPEVRVLFTVSMVYFSEKSNEIFHEERGVSAGV
jgi:hypothetical protein